MIHATARYQLRSWNSGIARNSAHSRRLGGVHTDVDNSAAQQLQVYDEVELAELDCYSALPGQHAAGNVGQFTAPNTVNPTRRRLMAQL